LVDDPGLERHRDRDEFDPIFWAHNGTVIAVDWAEGFLHAIMLRMEAWDRLLKSKRDGQLLIPILALCGDENGKSLLDLTPDEEDRFMEQAPDRRPSPPAPQPRSAVTILAPAALAKNSKSAAAKPHKQTPPSKFLPNAYDNARDSDGALLIKRHVNGARPV
jgi:Uncharacterised protein family (UPF0149)